MRKITSIFLVTILALALLCGCGDIKSEKSIAIGNQTFNLFNTGNCIKYSDWIIYSRPKLLFSNEINYKQNMQQGIYKYNITTGQTIQLSKYDGSYFNIINDKLIYLNEFNQIYYIDINTLEDNWISGVDSADALYVQDNMVFYRDANGNNIYKCDSKGGNKELVAEYTISDFQVVDNDIYYIDQQTSNLKKRNIETGETNTIIPELIESFFIYDKSIIFMFDQNIYCYNLENNTTDLVQENCGFRFVLKDDIIYYISEKNKINSVNYKTKELSTIFEAESDISSLQLYDNVLTYSYVDIDLLSRTARTKLCYIDLKNIKEIIVPFN